MYIKKKTNEQQQPIIFFKIFPYEIFDLFIYTWSFLSTDDLIPAPQLFRHYSIRVTFRYYQVLINTARKSHKNTFKVSQFFHSHITILYIFCTKNNNIYNIYICIIYTGGLSNICTNFLHNLQISLFIYNIYISL